MYLTMYWTKYTHYELLSTCYKQLHIFWSIGVLYLVSVCRFCKLFLSQSMIYWWPQCKHHILLSATWPGGRGNLFNNFTYTTSFGAGVYSFWFVELWLGYSMIWQEYHIFLDFIWLLFLVVNPNGTLLHQ